MSWKYKIHGSRKTLITLVRTSIQVLCVCEGVNVAGSVKALWATILEKRYINCSPFTKMHFHRMAFPLIDR